MQENTNRKMVHSHRRKLNIDIWSNRWNLYAFGRRRKIIIIVWRSSILRKPFDKNRDVYFAKLFIGFRSISMKPIRLASHKNFNHICILCVAYLFCKKIKIYMHDCAPWPYMTYVFCIGTYCTHQAIFTNILQMMKSRLNINMHF